MFSFCSQNVPARGIADLQLVVQQHTILRGVVGAGYWQQVALDFDLEQHAANVAARLREGANGCSGLLDDERLTELPLGTLAGNGNRVYVTCTYTTRALRTLIMDPSNDGAPLQRAMRDPGTRRARLGYVSDLLRSSGTRLTPSSLALQSPQTTVKFCWLPVPRGCHICRCSHFVEHRLRPAPVADRKHTAPTQDTSSSVPVLVDSPDWAVLPWCSVWQPENWRRCHWLSLLE
ncbi:hypothetical protein BDZ91DRAFT_815623 [Kalaharituber pfeilii]|nr:hypothetical protein BDZ91DRAFT_815623 [Kalaharituber pfeilii]